VLAYHRRMSRFGTHKALLLLALLIVVFFGLAVSIGASPLLDGKPFVLQLQRQGAGIGTSPGGREWIAWVLQTILAVLLITFPFVVIAELLTPDGRKRLLRRILFMALVMLALRAGSPALRNLIELRALQPGLAGELARSEAEAGLIPEIPPGPPSETIVFGVTAALALGLALLAVALFIRARRSRYVDDDPLLELGANAQTALDALRGGGALDETIQRCYFDMCHVLASQQGINRQTAMTPSEFESHLTERGLPRGAVHTLTSLFEQIRYGGISASAREQNMAIESLEAIVKACAARNRPATEAIPA
jgi:hypothetical protein